MSNRQPEVPDWVGYTVIALFAGAILAMFLASGSYDPFRIAGTVMLATIGIGVSAWFLWALIAPASDPRNITHTDCGKKVIVSVDFCAESGTSRGKVILSGEIWDAICEGESVPCEGDELIVERRDGLKLIVTPVNSVADPSV